RRQCWGAAMAFEEEEAARQLSTESFLWVLGSLCQVYRKPFDPALVLREFPPPCSIPVLHQAARSLGFKTGDLKPRDAALQGLALPCIAFLRESAELLQPALIVGADRDRLLYFRAGSQDAQTAQRKDFEQTFLPHLVLVS